MKKELQWWALFVVIAIVVAGLMTRFEFGVADIQLHDTYYVFESWVTILVVMIILGLLRGYMKIADILSNKSRFIAITIVVINGIFALGLMNGIRVVIRTLMRTKKWHPDLDISNYIGVIALMTSLLTLLIILEIQTITKLTIKDK